MNERKKTFKEEIDDLQPIPPRYKPLDRVDMIPDPGYGRAIDILTSPNIGVMNARKITETGMDMVSWFKEHVGSEFPCSACGSKTTMMCVDTDSASIRCESCGNVEYIPFDLVRKRMLEASKRIL